MRRLGDGGRRGGRRGGGGEGEKEGGRERESLHRVNPFLSCPCYDLMGFFPQVFLLIFREGMVNRKAGPPFRHCCFSVLPFFFFFSQIILSKDFNDIQKSRLSC